MRRTIITNEVAARYDLDLDLGWREIGRAVRRLERERMEEWAQAFIGALDRDLVDADDFSERR